MRTFIATIGWTEWPIASALLKHGLSKEDRIILLSPEKRDERSKEAINEVKSFISRFVPDVNVSDIPVPVHDPVKAVTILAKQINEEARRGGKMIVNLSGGMRVLVVEVLLALTLLRINDLALEIRTEDKVDIDIPKVWEPHPNLAREEIRILRILAKEGRLSLSEMAKTLRLSIATTHRILRRMEDSGALTSKRIGKERIAELTPKGKVISELFSEGKS